MYETSSGAMNGATQGATAGSTFGPWGTAIGAVVGGIGGALGGRAKSKAAKRRLKLMQQALRMFQAGSTDAFGNTLSADGSGRWSYNLNPSTQQAVNGANSALRSMGDYKVKSFNDILYDNLFGTAFSNNASANASQSNAMRKALQQGSNIGVISTAYNNNKMNTMRNKFQNSYNNALNYNGINAQNRANLATGASSMIKPIASIENNLQDMVNNLNKAEMDQMNRIAGAGADKTYAGRMTAANALSDFGDIISRFSNQPNTGSIENYNNSSYNANKDELINALIASILTNNSNNINQQEALQLLQFLG